MMKNVVGAEPGHALNWDIAVCTLIVMAILALWLRLWAAPEAPVELVLPAQEQP